MSHQVGRCEENLLEPDDVEVAQGPARGDFVGLLGLLSRRARAHAAARLWFKISRSTFLSIPCPRLMNLIATARHVRGSDRYLFERLCH